MAFPIPVLDVDAIVPCWKCETRQNKLVSPIKKKNNKNNLKLS